MSVLELDEESRSLREAARAWGRGELGIDDYRMIRRATLEGKLGLEPGSSVDDADETAQGARNHPTDDTEVVGSEHVDSSPASGRGMFIGGALAAVLLLVLHGFLLV
jgi:hypothetical protein